VLSILSITLNYQPATQGSAQIAPVVTFHLYGVAGSGDTQTFLFILLVVINLIVVVMTFALLVLRMTPLLFLLLLPLLFADLLFFSFF